MSSHRYVEDTYAVHICGDECSSTGIDKLNEGYAGDTRNVSGVNRPVHNTNWRNIHAAEKTIAILRQISVKEAGCLAECALEGTPSRLRRLAVSTGNQIRIWKAPDRTSDTSYHMQRYTPALKSRQVVTNLFRVEADESTN
jgi:hypothetical protein